MINFSVGPVQTFENILHIGGMQVPYFRTDEFSNIMFENEMFIKKFVNAQESAKTVFLTGSGTAAMEATILNTLTKNDKALIVNGGSFGQRFVDICKMHNIQYDEIKLAFGKELTLNDLEKFNGHNYTTFIVNIHETSTGVHYDLDLISNYCKQNHLFLIVDAISSFLADEISMQKNNIDVIITGSQKALACAPGVSIIVLSNVAIERINNNKIKCYYLNLKDALNNAMRGQTPFTPAVNILLQINERLHSIDNSGGVQSEINRVKYLAEYFRNKIIDLPFEIPVKSLSNAVTPLHPINVNAYSIFEILKTTYNIWICPNGGNLKDKIIRVGHIGNLTTIEFDILITALYDMKDKKLL